jgi:hypothetical protein
MILVGDPEGKRPFGRPRRRWEDNIQMISGKYDGGCGLDSSGPEQGPVVGSCGHENELAGAVR